MFQSVRRVNILILVVGLLIALPLIKLGWQVVSSSGGSMCDAVSMISLQGMGHARIISVGEDATHDRYPFNPPLPHGFYPRCHFVVATTGTATLPAGFYVSTIIITQVIENAARHQIGPRAWMVQRPYAIISLPVS